MHVMTIPTALICLLLLNTWISAQPAQILPHGDTLVQHVAELLPLDTTQLQQWHRATETQYGIIGNDFEGRQEIGTAALKRSLTFAKKWRFNWLMPFVRATDNGKAYKQTLCGTLHHTYDNLSTAAEAMFFSDNDLSLHIIPDLPYEYLLLEVPTIERTIEAEIDLKDFAQMQHLKTGNSAHMVNDKVCVYGPWTNDMMHQKWLVSLDLDASIDKKAHVEIHPREQTWWRKQYGNATYYYCQLACDNSNRFFDPKQYDPYKGTRLGLWTKPPLTGSFAIAFEKKHNQPALHYSLQIIDSYHANAYAHSYEYVQLVVGNEIIATVQIPQGSLFSVSFPSVGTDESGYIKGFCVISASVGGETEKQQPTGGHLLFAVRQE